MPVSRTSPTRLVAIIAGGLAVMLAACGSGGTHPPASSVENSSVSATASESIPPGDIPDTQVFVPFTSPDRLFTVSVPEGWARTTDGPATQFTDNSNSVRIETRVSAAAPTADSARADELGAIESSTPGYRLGAVSVVQRKAGPAILITYQGSSAPNPVTGKAGTDAIERYEFWRDGHEVILTLSGLVGSDNVDPWRTITDSLQWL